MEMIMSIGTMCKMCNIIFKNEERLLKHFIEEHPKLVLVKLEEFICSQQYMDEREEASEEVLK